MPKSNEPGAIAAKQPYDAALAAIHHGSHVCAFYETDDDLLDLVGQFCAAGARRGDQCLWVMPDGMNAGSLASKGVELHSGTDMYLKGEVFQSGPIITPACPPAVTPAG